MIVATFINPNTVLNYERMKSTYPVGKLCQNTYPCPMPVSSKIFNQQFEKLEFLGATRPKILPSDARNTLLGGASPPLRGSAPAGGSTSADCYVYLLKKA